jgi:AraC family transcriptional regulator
MSSVVVDFAREKEEGYKRIFSKSPLLSSVAVNWQGIYIAYDHFPAGQTPNICAKQHAIAIFVDLPTPAQVERQIDGQLRREQLQQGDIVLVPANVWHRVGSNQSGGAVVISLEPTQFVRTIHESLELEHVELVSHFATPDPLLYHLGLALKQSLEQALTDGPRMGQLYAEAMINALTVHLFQHYSTQKLTLPTYRSGLSQTKLQQVLEYIAANLDQNLSLGELAAIAGISSHYFSQLFKQSTGKAPHQYVLQHRIETAKELLASKQYSIAEVASRVGFVDQSHLHRHFKRLVGITPRAYQQQLSHYPLWFVK